MTVFGMGTLEIVVVLLVAFIVLGPKSMSDAARFLGKLVNQAREMVADLPAIQLNEDDLKPAGSGRTAPNQGSPGPKEHARSQSDGPDPSNICEPGIDDPKERDAPVEFRSSFDPPAKSLNSEDSIEDQNGAKK